MELKYPWKGIISAVIFAMQSTVHTTMQATPMQLMFGHDAIMNLTFDANWQLIRQQKQTAIHKTTNLKTTKEYNTSTKLKTQYWLKTNVLPSSAKTRIRVLGKF